MIMPLLFLLMQIAGWKKKRDHSVWWRIKAMKEEEDSVACLQSRKKLDRYFLFSSLFHRVTSSLCVIVCVCGRKCKIWHVVKNLFASRDYEAVVPELSSQENAEPNKQK
jgi:hypothetical protein